jgi:hypothetical protein
LYGLCSIQPLHDNGEADHGARTRDLVLQEDAPMGLAADTVLIRRDGSEAAIEDSAAPIHDWDGQMTGAVIVFHDVSAAQAMSMKMAHLAQLFCSIRRIDRSISLPHLMHMRDRHTRKFPYTFQFITIGIFWGIRTGPSEHLIYAD